MRRKIIIRTSIALYFISLVLPVFKELETGESVLGIQVLASGWVAIIFSEPRWFANVAYLYVILRMESNNSINILWLCFFTMLISSISVILFRNFTLFEDTKHTIFTYGAYTWSISLLLLSIELYFEIQKRKA